VALRCICAFNNETDRLDLVEAKLFRVEAVVSWLLLGSPGNVTN
jgi:hypothetical protein